MKEMIEEALQRVRERSGDEDFESGQCHTLALALQAQFGGELVAIIRNQVDGLGDVFSTTYSHMVCEIEGQLYDVNGANADELWCARWSTEPDKWGLVSEFEFKAIARSELAEFLADYDGIPVDPLIEAMLIDAMRAPAPTTPIYEEPGPGF